MFQDIPYKVIKDIVQRSLTMDSAVETLALYGDISNKNVEDWIETPEELREAYQSKLSDEEFEIKVDRENIWVSVLKVYKSCMAQKKQSKEEIDCCI